MDAPSATGSSVTVRRDAAAVAWWVLVGAAVGGDRRGARRRGGRPARDAAPAADVARRRDRDDLRRRVRDRRLLVRHGPARARDGDARWRSTAFSTPRSEALSRGSCGCRSGRSSPRRSAARASSTTTASTSRSSSPPRSRSRSSCSFPERRPRWSCCSSSAGCASSRGRTGVSRSGSASARSPGRSHSGSQVSSPPQRSSCGGHGSTLCSRALPGSPCPRALVVVTRVSGWELVSESTANRPLTEGSGAARAN